MKPIRSLLKSLLLTIIVTFNSFNALANSIESTIHVAGYIGNLEATSDDSDHEHVLEYRLEKNNSSFTAPNIGDEHNIDFYSVMFVSSLWLMCTLLLVRRFVGKDD